MSPIGVLFALTSASVATPAQLPLPESNTPPAYRADAPAEPNPFALSPRPSERSSWDEFAARPFSLESRIGFGTPVGALGVAGELSPSPALALGAGAGTNLVGLQLAAWLTGRIVLPSHEDVFGIRWVPALTLSSGFSGGRYVQSNVFENLTTVDGPGTAPRDYARAYWWNTDIGVEERHKSLVTRVFLGVALLLDPNSGVIDQSVSDARIEPISHTLFYVGLGVGIAP